MKKFIIVLTAMAVMSVMVGCASITVPVAATTNPVGSKVGKASGVVLFFNLMGKADVSIQEAAKNGGITQISTVDTGSIRWFGGLFTSYHTTVTGE